MPGFVSYQLRDYTKETSTVSVITGNVTAASIAGWLTQVGALRTAIEGLTLGIVAKETGKVFDTKLSNDAPTDPLAQREAVWIVTYEDNLQYFDAPVNAIPNAGYKKIFTDTIPTADLALLSSNPGEELDEIDLAAGPGASYVTAFEAIARSPYGGTVNVISIKNGGRNN